jgi:hypothetical protein
MVVHTSIGGSSIRVNLSSALGRPLVKVGSAHVALYKSDGSIVPGTDHELTFGGVSSCTLLPGVLLISDPVKMEIPPFTNLPYPFTFPKRQVFQLNTGLGFTQHGYPKEIQPEMKLCLNQRKPMPI